MTSDLNDHIARLSRERDKLETFLGRHAGFAAFARSRDGGAPAAEVERFAADVAADLAGNPVFTAWQALVGAIGALTEIASVALPAEATLPCADHTGPGAVLPVLPSSAARLPATLLDDRAGRARAVTIHAGPPEAGRGGSRARRAGAAPDDLTRIRGIDRRTAGALHEHGLRHYEQLAEFSPADVRTLAAALGLGRRISQENWIEQAAVLATRAAAARALSEAKARSGPLGGVVSSAAEPNLPRHVASTSVPALLASAPFASPSSEPHAGAAALREIQPPDAPALGAGRDAAERDAAAQPASSPADGAAALDRLVREAAERIGHGLARDAQAAPAGPAVTGGETRGAAAGPAPGGPTPLPEPLEPGRPVEQPPEPRTPEPLKEPPRPDTPVPVIPPGPQQPPHQPPVPEPPGPDLPEPDVPPGPDSPVEEPPRELPQFRDDATTPAPLTAEPAAAAEDAGASEARGCDAAATSAIPQLADRAPVPAGDDLALIAGLDDRLAARLAQAGVVRFEQIAAWCSADVGMWSEVLGPAARIARDGWIEQAAVLARGMTTNNARRRQRGDHLARVTPPAAPPRRDPAFAIWLARQTSELPLPKAALAPGGAGDADAARAGAATSVGDPVEAEIAGFEAASADTAEPAPPPRAEMSAAVAVFGDAANAQEADEAPLLTPSRPQSASPGAMPPEPPAASEPPAAVPPVLPPVLPHMPPAQPAQLPAARTDAPGSIAARLKALERDLAALDIVPLTPPQPRRAVLARTSAAESGPPGPPEPPPPPPWQPDRLRGALVVEPDSGHEFTTAAMAEADVTIVRRATREIGLEPLPESAAPRSANAPGLAEDAADYAAYRSRAEEASVEIVKPDGALSPSTRPPAPRSDRREAATDGGAAVNRFLAALKGGRPSRDG